MPESPAKYTRYYLDCYSLLQYRKGCYQTQKLFVFVALERILFLRLAHIICTIICKNRAKVGSFAGYLFHRTRGNCKLPRLINHIKKIPSFSSGEAYKANLLLKTITLLAATHPHLNLLFKNKAAFVTKCRQAIL